MTTAAATKSVGDLWVPIVLGVFGIYSLGLGMYMAVAPGSFYETFGPFSARNDHYIRDASTFTLANSLLLLGAVRWSGWRTAALVCTTLQWVLHTISHLWTSGRVTPRG